MEFNLELLKDRLIKRQFNAVVCKDKQEAAAYLSENYPVHEDMVVGMGNSLTLESLGLKELWEKQAVTVYQHGLASSEEETKSVMTADLYLTSANAISYSGEIVNIDGTGNRVSATCYGPDQVIYVIGKNKIAPTLEEAMDRARNSAAVKNAKRYNRKTPCTVTGKCEDCLSPECICAIMAIHRKQPFGVRITVILVDEEIGL